MGSETLVVKKRFTQYPEDSFNLERALADGAYDGLRRALTDHKPDDVIEIVKASGLRGRGGAGAGTGMKWSFVPKDVSPKYVVVNDDEGEPCTFKDRELTERDPHAIIEGALIAAYAVDAEAVYIYVRGEFGLGRARLDTAIQDARSKGLIGENILGMGFDCEVFTHPGAGAYICGEETALLDSLEGFRGQPRMKPPFPAVEGLYRKPTVVNNVETLATLPHIILNGVDWFRSMGTEKSPGTRIFAVSGRVNRPGNYELALGGPMTDLIDIAGGIKDNRVFKAVTGGASAPWLNTTDITLDWEAFAEVASMLGSGSMIFTDETSCMVEMALVTTRFFNEESCGKCTPCREGTWWGVKVLERLERGEGQRSDLDLLLNICDTMSAPGPAYIPMGQCFCPLGDGAAWALRSIINLFREEFDAHLEKGHCPFKQEVRAS